MNLRKIAQIAFIVSGGCLVANGIFLLFLSNINIGPIATLLLGVILLFSGICINGVVKSIPKWIKAVFLSGLLIVTFFISFLLIHGMSESATYKEDAIIVLGCGIRGEKITESLRQRLDRAIEYYHDNEDAIIVVSGGQGPQEDITEALAMERYLISKGIPADKIIKEESSTSTYENFKYTKVILDEYFENDYSIVYVTSDYHTYRAGAIARSVGYENVTHCSADTPWYSKLPCCLRECVGVLRFVLLGE